MGDMADLELDRMESGKSIVRNKKTGKEFIIDNIILISSKEYDNEDLYEIKDCIEE